jgi:predicted nuclease with TOPRIM domain
MNNPKLEEALKRREEFLKEHPEYQAYQDEIDRLLSAAPPEKRLEVLMMLLAGKASELGALLTELLKKKALQ